MSDKNNTQKSERVLREESTIQFWKDNKIFKKTVEKEPTKGEFVFYEGPPTANGKPGIHHLESRAFKDAVPRYKTMRGYKVKRKAGWDTHGLPVEIEVEKQLGIKSKIEIEEYGIAEFNKKCKESVWTYVELWEKFSERVGYWTDMDNPYITYEPDYMETLWWVIGQIDKKDLLYKDYKVLPWCPRCGTALSSHELAQGYKTVKDLSLTAKFEIRNSKSETNSNNQNPNIKTYILAWTTTPWTLPGNVALAVGDKIEYVKVRHEDEHYILAKARVESVLKDLEYEVVDEFKGSELVGLSYKPLFPFLKDIISDEQKDKLENAYKVYPADFVTTDDGTGVVHTAVMYGVDDFNLGTEIGLPKEHLINEKGEFLPGTGFLEGRFVKDLETDIEILKALQEEGTYFKKEKYEHSYPHCWRCKTPLIYFARDSWYVRMTDLRDDMVASNKKINWEPEHIREGRFGEWIEGVKDWAFSRERYWGTPLPIWVSEDGEEKIVVDSFETLKKHTKKSGNKYTVIRHGEAESNVLKIISDKADNPHHLTELGKKQCLEAAKSLKDKGIDIIITSPFVRTRETAEIIRGHLDLSSDAVIEDDRIMEIQTGGFNLRGHDEYHKGVKDDPNIFSAPGGERETLLDLKQRMGAFLYDIDSKYENKNILIVTHGSPSWMLFSAAYGYTEREMKGLDVIENLSYLDNAEYRELDFAPLPHNENFERDLHRPYVDDVVLFSNKGTELKRVNEVVDVWFDSGCMPFAQHHYPFENKEYVNETAFPADYISEAIDQTRGWFYTLHAVSALLGKGEAYKNVISLGHLLDAEGKKMSKSIGNVMDPFLMSDKYGVDILRMWMYSVNQPGDSKNFDEKTVDEMSKKILNLLENVVSFYEIYSADEKVDTGLVSDNPLDKWIVAKLKELHILTTNSLDEYRLLEPARGIREFIGELSQWYVRRSRDRFKSDDEKEKREAVATTRFVLLELSKIIAPFMPFSAEYVYRTVWREEKAKTVKDGSPDTSSEVFRGERRMESVHLEDWSEFELSDEEILLMEQMREVRDIASLGLEARDKAGIKVRQPLSNLKVKSQKSKVQNDDALIQIIKDEINVKEVVFAEAEELSVELDTEITEELKKEGVLREFVRAVQNMRKEMGLDPMDTLSSMSVETEDEEFINEFMEEIKSLTRVSTVVFGKMEGATEISIEDKIFLVGLPK